MKRILTRFSLRLAVAVSGLFELLSYCMVRGVTESLQIIL